jgi:prepilin-type processing-associated H-X9-DG protein
MARVDVLAAIIACFLIWMILAVFQGNEGHVKALSCKSNLQRLQQAMLVYSSDHGGDTPKNSYGWPNGYIETVEGSWVLGNAQHDVDASNIKRGVLWDYVEDISLYHCPSDDSTSVEMPNKKRFRSYSMSVSFVYSRLPRYGESGYFIPFFVANVADIDDPSRMFGFIGVSSETIGSGFFGPSGIAANVQSEELLRWKELPSERHDGGTYVTFMDGSVRYKQWLHPNKRRSGVKTPPFDDKDLSDLRWLQERTSKHLWIPAKNPR